MAKPNANQQSDQGQASRGAQRNPSKQAERREKPLNLRQENVADETTRRRERAKLFREKNRARRMK